MRVLLGVLVVSSLGTAVAGAKQTADDLPEPHRRWLEEEVVYLVTEREKEIFSLLETEEERDGFVEAFWRRRDTNPTYNSLCSIHVKSREQAGMAACWRELVNGTLRHTELAVSP